MYVKLLKIYFRVRKCCVYLGLEMGTDWGKIHASIWGEKKCSSS